MHASIYLRSLLCTAGDDHKEILSWNLRIRNGKSPSRNEGRGRTVYTVGFSMDSRYISWGHTLDFATLNDRGPLTHRFDLEALARLAEGVSPTDALQTTETIAKLSLKNAAPTRIICRST